MGYRSEVIIALNREVLARALIGQPLPSLLQEQSPVMGEHGAYWRFTDVKWYPNYADVQQVNAFFDELDELEREDGAEPLYGFLRIGEDTNDIESKGEPWEFDVSARTSIEYPVNFP